MAFAISSQISSKTYLPYSHSQSHTYIKDSPMPQYGWEKPYIKSGKSVGKWIENVNNESKSKIYSLHSKIYLPAISKFNSVLQHAVYSTLKSKSMAFYYRHIGFLHSHPFYQLTPHRVNMGNDLMVETGILLPLPFSSWFFHFLYRVALHW